jgi:predicted LPLAT superfamily acyltransferase
MSHWQQREGGGLFAIWLIRTIALGLGRRVARVLLYPIALYFFLRRADERAASRAYLSRVLDRPVTGFDIFRHIHMFAATLLDRMFFLARGERDFSVDVEGLADLDRWIDAGRGVLLIGSHQGSFEALRALGARRAPARGPRQAEDAGVDDGARGTRAGCRRGGDRCVARRYVGRAGDGRERGRGRDGGASGGSRTSS